MKTGLQQDFEFLKRIQANRVHCEQLIVLHKESDIRCVLNFTVHSELLRSKQATKIIGDYMILHPMCKLIVFIIGSIII